MSSLFTKKEAELYQEDICQATNQRFWHWLITKNISESENFDDGLMQTDFIPDDVALDSGTRKKGQRLLLEIEREGALRRAEEKLQEQRLKNEGNKLLATKMRQDMISSLSVDGSKLLQLSRLPASLPRLLDALLSPSTNYRTLAGILNTIPGLNKQLLNLINNTDFCHSIGKDFKVVKDPQVAVGVIGVDTAKVLLPMMAIKNTLRFSCPHFPMMSTKIWSYGVVKANASSILTEAMNPDNERLATEAFVTGLFSIIPLAIIQHQFATSFENMQEQCLVALREKQQRALYNAVFQAQASSNLMLEMTLELYHPLLKRLNDAFEWPERLKNSSEAIELLATNKKTDDRGSLPFIMKSTDSYARFDMLRRARLFSAKEHVRQYLHSAGMNTKMVNLLIKQDLRKIQLTND